MRRFLLPVIAALVLMPGIARAGDADGGGSGAASAPASDSKLGAWLGALLAERPARPATNEVDFVRAFADRWGVPCREYVRHVLIGERPVEASGTVCRAADGSWSLRE